MNKKEKAKAIEEFRRRWESERRQFWELDSNLSDLEAAEKVAEKIDPRMSCSDGIAAIIAMRKKMLAK